METFSVAFANQILINTNEPHESFCGVVYYYYYYYMFYTFRYYTKYV